MAGVVLLVIVVIVIVVVALAAWGGGRGRRRTIVLKATPAEIYDRMYRWFALQEHEIEQEVKNQKLQVKLSGTAYTYIIIGILLLLLAIVPGVLWFVFARSRISVTLQDSPQKARTSWPICVAPALPPCGTNWSVCCQ